MNILETPVSRNDPARLLAADQFTQFGDGYRQIVGADTVAEGSVEEMLAAADSYGGARRHLFIVVDAAFRTPEETRNWLSD